jgi:hypothetical protein
MEENIKENRSQVLHKKLKNNWEKRVYMEVYTRQAKRGIR